MTIHPQTYKHIESSLIKKGEMGSSHVNMAPNTQGRLIGKMFNINLNFLMTKETDSG